MVNINASGNINADRAFQCILRHSQILFWLQCWSRDLETSCFGKQRNLNAPDRVTVFISMDRFNVLIYYSNKQHLERCFPLSCDWSTESYHGKQTMNILTHLLTYLYMIAIPSLAKSRLPVVSIANETISRGIDRYFAMKLFPDLHTFICLCPIKMNLTF